MDKFSFNDWLSGSVVLIRMFLIFKRKRREIESFSCVCFDRQLQHNFIRIQNHSLFKLSFQSKEMIITYVWGYTDKKCCTLFSKQCKKMFKNNIPRKRDSKISFCLASYLNVRCWHKWPLLTQMSAVDTNDRCWHKCPLLTQMSAVDTNVRCWHKWPAFIQLTRPLLHFHDDYCLCSSSPQLFWTISVFI